MKITMSLHSNLRIQKCTVQALPEMVILLDKSTQTFIQGVYLSYWIAFFWDIEKQIASESENDHEDTH